jgi:PadR family transcriptional regulator, regulatory protein AphA
MASKPTATSFALLGLLGVQPWTAYELVGQARRSLRHCWPRSEAHLYAELKRLVERGHANAEVEDGRRRQRTRYTITAEGHAALREWMGTEPAPPLLEVEGLLRVFLADQGTKEDLRVALEATAQHARNLHAGGAEVIRNQLETGGPFPQRLHVSPPLTAFFDDFYRLLIDCCEKTLAEIETWPDTKDVGLTPDGRERLERILARPKP